MTLPSKYRAFLLTLPALTFASLLTGYIDLPVAWAGLEFSETTPAAKEETQRPKPAVPQVQVFGKSKPAQSEPQAEPRVDPLAERQAELRSPAPAEDDSEFESLRRRVRVRRVAEAEIQTATDAVPAARSTPSSPARGFPTVRAAPTMETEVITPQKSNQPKGSKFNKNGKPAAASAAIEPEEPRGTEVNVAFAYTHLLPSPFVLSQGTWVLGTSVAYGLFDFLQISTNVARTFRQQWNIQAKVPLIEYPTFVASAFVNYELYNPSNIDVSNPDVWLRRWLPGIVTAYELNPDMAIFFGGNFNFGNDSAPVLTTSGYLRGAQVNAEWSYLYNPVSSRLGNNAISVGVKYDLTYEMFGFGFTHHWRSFEAGLHYTFADRERFLPIFGFSISTRI